MSPGRSESSQRFGRSRGIKTASSTAKSICACKRNQTTRATELFDSRGRCGHPPLCREKSKLGGHARRNSHGLRSFWFRDGPQFALLMFQRCADERCKEWMWLQRLRFEFRMELAAEEPRVIRGLDDFHVILIRRASRDPQARGNQRLFVVAIKLVAMPVAFADLQFAVGFVCEGAGFEFAWPGAQPHRAAHFIHAQQFAQFINHSVRRLRIKLRAVCLLHPGYVARVFDRRALHSQANPEKRHLVFTRVLNRVHHSLNPALPKSAW